MFGAYALFLYVVIIFKVGAVQISHELQKQLEKVVQGLGYEFWGMEMAQEGRRPILRFYIESPNGISHQDCQLVSRQVEAFLEVELSEQTSFCLEVSSPGADRRLFNLNQCARYVGCTVLLKLIASVQDRKNYTGVLLRTTQAEIELHVDGVGAVAFSFSNVSRASLVPDFSKSRTVQ